MLLACAAGSMGHCAPAWAQDTQPADASKPAAATQAEPALADIVVVAQKRSQNVQDVPITITALSGEQLASRGITAVESLDKATPGVLVTEYGGSPVSTSINIRGVAQLDYADHQETPNAVYVNGVYNSFQGTVGVAMYDIADLEILRGPQGTLFGRNATGGLIQITTRKPTDAFDGYLQASYGSYNKVNLEGAVGGALAPDLTTRVSVSYNRQDGYYRNRLGADFGGDNTLNARVQLQYKFDIDTKDLFEASISRSFPVAAGTYIPYPVAPNPANHGLNQPDSGALFVSNCAALGYTVSPGATNCTGYVRSPSLGPWQVETPFVGQFDRTIYGFSNTFTHGFGSVTLTSITNYTNFKRNYTEDDSDGPNPIYGFQANARAHQVSEEIRLNGRSSRLEWVLGGYFLDIKGSYVQGEGYGNFFNPALVTLALYTQKVDTYALFGQAEYKLTDKLSVIAGLRGNIDDKRFDLVGYCSSDPATCASYGSGPNGASFGGTYNRKDWSGRLQLTYKITPEAMIYAGVNRGNKSASIVSPSQSPLPTTTFQTQLVLPEVLTAYEAGFKTSWFNNRLRFNGDVYYYDYRNMQAFKYNGLVAVLFNANAKDYGAEFDLTALLTRHTTLSGALSLMHTRVENVQLPDGTFADQQQPFAPHSSWNVNLRQELPTGIGTFFGQVAATYTGSHYFSTVNEPATYTGGYTVVDLSAGWTSNDKKTSLTVSALNLTDKAYPIAMYNLAVVAGYGQLNYGAPRMINVQLKRSF